ncbi:hypothetical protein Bbelb_124280 [Branchiostoma belcheri]|nr:hypothetical protein Bbelb_124280 [Branchiostoma belcheri]
MWRRGSPDRAPSGASYGNSSEVGMVLYGCSIRTSDEINDRPGRHQGACPVSSSETCRVPISRAGNNLGTSFVRAEFGPHGLFSVSGRALKLCSHSSSPKITLSTAARIAESDFNNVTTTCDMRLVTDRSIFIHLSHETSMAML